MNAVIDNVSKLYNLQAILTTQNTMNVNADLLGAGTNVGCGVNGAWGGTPPTAWE